ncbi:DUF6239 family natural product biosynthesis protein [Actinomycetospora atypica]|uniref:DUF6239 family natural product biosynthesis protein n=1 Tax=Actinomycetospora atypica TaxID=1290095 RepID=A0ABV9YMW8_9PSEU
MVPAQGHDHGIDLPVVVGPLLLENMLTLGLLTAVVAVALRPFLDGRDEALHAKAATLGAAAAGVSLLLTRGPLDGMPTGGLAALAIAGLAVPFAAVRGDRPRLRAVVARAAPAVVLVSASSAITATATGAMFAAAVGLAWSSLARMAAWRSHPDRSAGRPHRARPPTPQLPGP